MFTKLLKFFLIIYFSTKKSDMLITDDIVYTRQQAKNLRKQGFIIPSYRVLAGKSERLMRMGHGSSKGGAGDRAVVAVNRNCDYFSEIMTHQKS